VACALKTRPGGPHPRRRGALTLWLALAALPATAQITPLSGQSLSMYRPSSAFTGDYLAAEGGFIYTDNVTRSASGSDQVLLTAGLSGDIAREGPRLDYRLSSNLVLLKYLGGAYPTEPSGYLDGTLKFKILPGFLTWIVRETFSEVQIDPYTPATPDNLVNLNFITTGPRFTVRPTLRTSVTLDALYSYVTSSSAATQFANLDSHRYGGDLRVDRAFSEDASLYLKGHYEKVDFKDQVNNNNFSTGEASAGYQLTDGRTVLDLSGGYSQLRVYDVLTTVEGPGGSRETQTTEQFHEPIWKVDLSRLVTPNQRVALHASEQFTDAVSQFRLGFDQPIPTMAPQPFASSDPFKQRQYSLDWRFQGARTVVNVSLLELRQHFLLKAVNDLQTKSANVTLTRLLSPVLLWDLGASISRNEQIGTAPPDAIEPTPTGQSSKLYGLSTGLRWQVGQHLTMRFIYVHSRQNGVFSENQVGVIASWALLGANASIMQSAGGLAPVATSSTRYQ
jgi:hypothetical protein